MVQAADLLRSAQDAARRSDWHEAVRLAKAAADAPGATTAIRAQAWHIAGLVLSTRLLDTSRAPLAYMADAIDAAKKAGEADLVRKCLANGSNVAVRMGEYTQAESWATELCAEGCPDSYRFWGYWNQGWAAHVQKR